MISLVLASALAAAQANPTVQPRKAYSSCLETFMRKSLDTKMDPAAFDEAVKPACTAQESAFRSASIAYDIKMGADRSQAEEDAEFQIDDYLTVIKSDYRVYHESGEKPVG